MFGIALCHNSSLALFSMEKITPMVATLMQERREDSPSPHWRLLLEAGAPKHLTEGGLPVAMEVAQAFLAATL